MNQKSWYVLRVVVSLYLAYLGVRIILDVIKGKPENMVFMLAMAVIFIVVGVLYGIFSIRKVWAIRNEEEQYGGEVAEEDDAEENNMPENADDKESKLEKQDNSEDSPDAGHSSDTEDLSGSGASSGSDNSN